MTSIFGRRAISFLAAGAALATVGALPAAAQTKAGAVAADEQEDVAEEGEIVVSAQRFDQKLQDTPLAVTAIDASTLRDRQAQNLRDIGSLVPGLVVEAVVGLQNAPRIFLRGVGQDSATFNSDSAVGTYVDNVYIPRLYAGLFDFADVERLEVLRGPQGTLYGRNTSGGAINIITRKPTFELSGMAEVAYGSYEQLDAKGFVSGGLSDKVAASLSVLHRQRSGISRAPNLGKDVNDRKVNAQRIKLLFQPTDELEILLAGEHSRDDSGPYYPSAIQAAVPAQLPNARVDRDIFVTDATSPDDSVGEAYGATLTARWSRDQLAITSISAYRHLRQEAIVPLTTIPFTAGVSGIYFKNYSISQEFNAAYNAERLDLVAGLYYFRERSAFQNRVGTNPLEDSIQKTNSYAVYAQGTFRVTPELGIIAGGRYTYDSKPFYNFYFVPTPQVPVRRPLQRTESWDGFIPKVGVEYKPSEEVLAYANYTKGFKAGGWNRVPPSISNGVLVYDLFPYNPERVEAYEAGLKLQTADRRATINIAAFWNNLSGLQVSQQIPGTTVARITNAAKARVRGFEIEASVTPVAGLLLFGNAAYNDGDYKGAFTCTDLNFVFRDCSQKELRGVSKWKALAGATYTYTLAEQERIRVNGTLNYTGRYFNDAFNNALVASRGRTLFDAFASYRTRDGRWTLTLEGKNITNKRYYGTALPIGQTIVVYPNDPRIIAGRIGYSF